MSVVGSDCLSTLELPQSGNVVARGRHKVRRVGRKGGVPDPPLMPEERLGEGEGVARRAPNLDRAVC